VKQVVIVMLLAMATLMAGCDLGGKDVRMAVINTRDVVTKCNIGIRAVEDVQKQFTDRRNSLKSKEDAIQQLQATPGINDPKSPKREDLQRLVQEYNEASQQLRKDVGAEEAIKFKPVVDKINKALSEYAKEKGLVSVQDRNGFAYIDPSIDITETIIKRVDQMQ
jgi:outer membrane protein